MKRGNATGFSVLLAVSMCLNACSAMMIGGSGVGTYEGGKDERNAAQVSADSAITTSILRKYDADQMIRSFNVGVVTVGGRVMLSGTVDSYAAREMAERLAIETDGVKAVDNQIRVQNSE
jgi:osmotically-inducible protein OsmY